MRIIHKYFIGTPVADISDDLTDLAGKVIDKTKDAFDKVQDHAKDAFNKVQDHTKDALDDVKDFTNNVVDSVNGSNTIHGNILVSVIMMTFCYVFFWNKRRLIWKLMGELLRREVVIAGRSLGSYGALIWFNYLI